MPECQDAGEPVLAALAQTGNQDALEVLPSRLWLDPPTRTTGPANAVGFSVAPARRPLDQLEHTDG
jgi:hypothetical protein